MAKDDTSQGLLSKMVKFVRNPATNWGDLDSKETDRDEAVSKLLLKEMIERKRRNDFVRRREFDMLRKMRKRESMVSLDAAGRPSFFQSSMPSKPDDRAKTLKKIDEIEAQMSMQWWKTKQVTSTLQSSDPSNFPTDADGRAPPHPAMPLKANTLNQADLPAGYGVTEPMDLQARTAVTAPAPISAQEDLLAQRPAGRQAESVIPVPVDTKPNVMQTFYAAPSAAKLAAQHFNSMDVEPLEITHDAELEEASISFANSDDAAAEAGILEMLAADGSRVGQSETWMALFDLYRATDQQDKFENVAIKFVQKFDRSAPQWFSMPDMVRILYAPVSASPTSRLPADWVCSSSLGLQTVAALKAALGKAPMPWRLDWSNLKVIEPAAVEPLLRLFASWSAQPVQVGFIGNAQLQQLLQTATPSGNRDTAQNWWHLRMEALRVTHRPDEFELAALDFCVTYEVSPPAWEIARCVYKSIDAQGFASTGHAIVGDVYRDSAPFLPSALDGDSLLDPVSSQMSNLLSVELSGHIEGDAVAILDQLEAKLMGADIMIISCAKLIRVDFSAAGTLLNWVSSRQAENRAVQFTDVNRLVAAFFNVIGITEHAKVTIRRD